MPHLHGAAAAAKTAADHAMMGQHAQGAMQFMGTGHSMAAMTKGAAAAGAALTARKSTGGFMSALAKHPVLVFGLGLTAGYLIHKYRKEIITAATQIGEQGKDFVLQQRENLEDLVAECHEKADEAS